LSLDERVQIEKHLDAVDVVPDGSGLRIVHAASGATRGERLVERMRGRATVALSTDELMALLRDE
jgi:hypothetical protein